MVATQAGTVIEYPALYMHTDAVAGEERRTYTRFVGGDLLLVFAGSVASLASGFNPNLSHYSVAIAALVLFASTVLKYLNRHRHADRNWLDDRAVAESVKTATWRFMMRVPPYAAAEAPAEAIFAQTLEEITHIPGLMDKCIGDLAPDHRQITMGMRTVRGEGLIGRRDLYLGKRITDQINWYLGKGVRSKRAATRWYRLSLVCQVGGIALTLLHAIKPYGPNVAPLLLTLAASVVAWDQLGRNQELSKSYRLSAADLTTLRAAITTASDEETFTKHVADAEDLISHEHARWASKRS